MGQNVKLRQRIHEAQYYTGDRKDLISEISGRVAQAKCNKEELFRDCSSFELNFADSKGGRMYWQIAEMKSLIEETKQKINNL